MTGKYVFLVIAVIAVLAFVLLVPILPNANPPPPSIACGNAANKGVTCVLWVDGYASISSKFLGAGGVLSQSFGYYLVG